MTEQIKLRTWGDLCNQVEQEKKQLKQEIDNGKMWGNWKYNLTEPPSIDFAPQQYEITLDRINSDEKLGSWLLHLSGKKWMTTDDLGQLVVALTDLEEIGYHEVKRLQNP